MSTAVLISQVLAADPPPVPLSGVFWSEVVGTGLLTLLGCGVVANVVLSRTLGHAGGWLLINFGWGLAVFTGVYAAYRSGAHINPAVTMGILANGSDSYAPGVAVTTASTLTYIAGELVGAFLGAVLVFLVYKRHFDVHGSEPAAAEVDLRSDLDGLRDDVRSLHADVLSGGLSGGRLGDDEPPRHSGDRRLQAATERAVLTDARVDERERSEPSPQAGPTPAPQSEPAGAADKLGVFCTGPAIPAPAWNVLTEIIGTFVLVFVVLLFARTPSGLGPLAVALLVVGIGASLGGPTGYAINPARDLGPRVAHALLPIRGKGGSNWGYAWVPIVGPLIGGVLAGLAARLMT